MLLVVLFALLPTIAGAAAVDPDEGAIEMAVLQSEIDAAVAPVRSHADLQRHLATTPDSPLHRLTQAQRQKFFDGLVFADDGLVSYSWVPLENALSVTDTYRVLALLGAQSSISTVEGMNPANAAEVAMLEESGVSTLASMPPWAHGVCVVNGTSRRCVRQYGSNCSRACDR